jgi:rhodanese-related sulfurtransferase
MYSLNFEVTMTAVKFVEFKSKIPNARLPTVNDVTTDEVRTKMQNVLIVDVRRPDEWIGEFGHIPDAMHLILDMLPARIQELPKDKTIVFVCRSGARSAQAAAFALENGLKSVYNMQGGMMEWTKKNYETEERSSDS